MTLTVMLSALAKKASRRAVFLVAVLLALVGWAYAPAPAAHAQSASVTGLAVTVSGTPAVGGTVTLTATAVDPTGLPEYDFWVQDPSGTWTQMGQGYSFSGQLVLSLPQAGSYVVDCYALDAAQVAVGAWSDAVMVQKVFNLAPAPVLQVSPATPVVGSAVSLNARATGIPSPIYEFWEQRPDGTWTDLTGYIPSPTLSVSPNTPGTYTFVVYVAPEASVAPWTAAVESAPVAVSVGSTTPTVTVSGTVQNGLLLFPVILRQEVNGQWVEVQGNAMLDTGNMFSAALNGTTLEAAGGVPSSQTVTAYGFGGASTVNLWPHVWVAPAADPQAWILADQTIPGGLGALGDPSLVVNLGLPTLEQGTLTLNGDTWTWTYTPAP